MPTGLEGAERFVELSHGQTRYFEQGTGEPCLLVHGLGIYEGGISWFRNVEALSERFRVIAPDMLGWGVGDRPERHLSFPYSVDFLRELQDALEIESSHLVGHSLGGWIAQLLAYESPQRVRRLALIAPAGHDPLKLPPSLKDFVPPTRDSMRERLSALPDLDGADLDAVLDAQWANLSQPGAVDAYLQMCEFMTNIEERRRYVTARRWSRITAPTLVVSGEADRAYPPSTGAMIAAAVPGARHEVLATGHFVQQEAPKELNALLVDFLGGEPA